jgi:hypothetical protein
LFYYLTVGGLRRPFPYPRHPRRHPRGPRRGRCRIQLREWRRLRRSPRQAAQELKEVVGLPVRMVGPDRRRRFHLVSASPVAWRGRLPALRTKVAWREKSGWGVATMMTHFGRTPAIHHCPNSRFPYQRHSKMRAMVPHHFTRACQPTQAEASPRPNTLTCSPFCRGTAGA